MVESSVGICVVLASRSDPRVGLARLRARGQLTEMRVAELRFTPAEAGELLQHAAPALPDASVAALAARTEGWAAGLALAALSLRGHDDAASFVSAFTGSHRYVLDYLAEEVLERQDEQLRTFLVETSVLDRLSGPLCDAVTGRGGSQVLLEQAERAAAEVPLGYLARLQRAFGPGRPARDPVPCGIVDPLTSRELEVLEMLAAGRSNQAIASELVVTLDTVKKHVGHVLGKLGAANRTEAVARARELNLL